MVEGGVEELARVEAGLGGTLAVEPLRDLRHPLRARAMEGWPLVAPGHLEKKIIAVTSMLQLRLGEVL